SFQSSASGGGALRRVIAGQPLASSALSLIMCCWVPGTSSSGTIALTGHSGMQTAQSMHSSGSIVRKLGPSRKQSTGQTSTQSVYLQRMHDSTTTWVMACEVSLGKGSRGHRRTRLGRTPRQPPGAEHQWQFYGSRVGTRFEGCLAAAGALASALAPTPTVTTAGRALCS